MSLKSTVRETGILGSSGIRVRCVVEATKVDNPAVGEPSHVELKIAEVSANFPNGDYDLQAFGGRHLIRRSNGKWITVFTFLP